MTIKARTGQGRAARAVETIEQDKRAWELRCARLTEREIATQLGISPSTAHEAWQRGAKLVPAVGQDEYREAELAELERIARHLLGVMAREHVKVDHGRVIMDLVRNPETGEVTQRRMLDDAPGVQAALGLLRVQARRSALLGLDAPARVRITVVTEDEVDAEIRRLEAKLSQNDPKESAEPV